MTTDRGRWTTARRAILAGAVFAALVLGGTQAKPLGSPHPPLPLRVALVPYAGDVHNIVADALHLHKGSWPSPIIFYTTRPRGGVAALAEGRAKLATMPLMTFVESALQQQHDAVPDAERLVVVARLSYISGLDIVVADRAQGVETYADIVLHPIGLMPGSVAEPLLDFILDSRDLGDAQPTVVPMPPGEMAAALRQERIATAIIWSPFLDRIVASDPDRFHVLPSDDYFSEALLLVSQERYLNRDRAQIRAYLEGLLAAEDLLYTNPEEVVTAIAEDQGVSEAAVMRNIERSSLALQVENFPPYLYQPITRWSCNRYETLECVIPSGAFRASDILKEITRPD
ncbi:ABC transporter substrate-binding protein [Rhodovulum adriaticum]|nr:ABC transporter substrate-binding protein [Rhodovulum adriaticum]